MRNYHAEKERYMRLTDELMNFIKDHNIAPSLLIENGVRVGSAMKVVYNKEPETFLHLRGNTVMQLCKVLDKKRKGKYFEQSLRSIFDHDKQFFYKWRKELQDNKDLGSVVVRNCIREKYVGENEYRFNISKMIEVLDYINDLEQDRKEKKRRMRNGGN